MSSLPCNGFVYGRLLPGAFIVSNAAGRVSLPSEDCTENKPIYFFFVNGFGNIYQNYLFIMEAMEKNAET